MLRCPVVPVGPSTVKVISLLVALKAMPESVELDETENSSSTGACVLNDWIGVLLQLSDVSLQ